MALLLLAAGCGSGSDGPAGPAPGDTLELDLPDTFEPGRQYLGRRGYVEYRPGTLPIILAAPHGGDLTPDEIPDRTSGVTVTDLNTRELTRGLSDALMNRSGRRPHVVISHLDREKLDPNRPEAQASEGNTFARRAWREYHAFLEAAGRAVEETHGAGLFLDVHGHGHPVDRIELGYLLDSRDLALDDAALDGLAGGSSVREVVERTGISLSALSRGRWALGTLLGDAGFPAVPSAQVPDPGDDPFFSGGYSTAVHGSRDGGGVSAIQLEHHYPGLRDTPANRAAYAAAMAELVVAWLERYTPWRLTPPG